MPELFPLNSVLEGGRARVAHQKVETDNCRPSRATEYSLENPGARFRRSKGRLRNFEVHLIHLINLADIRNPARLSEALLLLPTRKGCWF